MSTQKMLKDYLDEKNVFTSSIHPLVADAIKTITGEVPYRLKLSIALSELVTIASHMRKNIELYDGTIVPCNAITFGLAGSGVSKDASMNAIRKALKPAYNVINTYRTDLARYNAEKAAIMDGKQAEDWSAYYTKPRDLAAGLGTVEGVVNHFSDLVKGDIGSAFLQASEIGSELLSNGSMLEIVKTISIGYDLGKIPAKIVKSNDNQTDSIDGLPINALFFGSQDAILYDNSVKAKFKMMFNTQLARRSIFSFSPEELLPPPFFSIEEVSVYRNKERANALQAQENLSESILKMVETTNQEPLKLSVEAQTLFDVYKEYNALLAKEMSARFPISKLSRRHKQWLALKMSGTYAILDGNDEVTPINYAMAVSTIESLTNDLMNFEEELMKEPYEIFSEFCKHNAEDGKFTIGLHELRKLQYIPTTGSPKTKIEELVHLASSYDKDGIYTACNENGICYEEIVKTDVAGVSYMQVSGTKSQRAKQCAEGYEFYETDFEELGAMLCEDFAYSPFRFKDGVRSKDNIIGGAKFVALDVDKSKITDEECHLLLEGINHHIARTSDKNNQFKFRVLIELDAIVDLEDRLWPKFLSAIGKELGLEVDLLPRSQIYFSYEDRNVLSEIEGEPLETRDLILEANKELESKPKTKKLSSNEQKALLADKMNTFDYAYNAAHGEGSRSLVRAGLHAIDLNATEDEVEKLIHSINNFWVDSMDSDRLENTVLSYLRRKF